MPMVLPKLRSTETIDCTVYGTGRFVLNTENTARCPLESFCTIGNASSVYIGHLRPLAAASDLIQIVRKGTKGFAALSRTVAGRCGLKSMPEPPRMTVSDMCGTVHANPTRGATLLPSE